jgi:endonuclease/exonuclease/phosphatase family metal-dependent hydrolase
VQDMRRLTLLLFVIWAAQLFAADAIKITTWNLKWFPSGVANRKDPTVETVRIAQEAAVLRDIDPDIVLLQEVRDEDSAERLFEAIAPQRYQLAIVSRFNEGATVGWQQLVIAAKFPAKAAFARRWKTSGLVDPPRGFAYAVFQMGRQTVAVCSVHLKSNLTRGDTFRQTQLNILKRELAAQQLVEQLRGLAADTVIQPEVIVVGGDFNTSPDDLRFASEKTLRIFSDAGFVNPIMTLLPDRRITIPGDGHYPPATFDHILVRQTKVPKAIVTPSPVSDHWPVTITLEASDK